MFETAIRRRSGARRRTGGLGLAVLVGYGLLCLLVVRPLFGFPLTLDQRFFLPISFYLAGTGQIQLPWWSPFPTTYLNWHGFLQPVLIEALAPGRDWTALFIGQGLLAAAGFLLFVALGRALRVRPVLLIPAGLVTISLMLDYRARPELTGSILTMLLVAVCAAWGRVIATPWRGAAIGGLIVLIGCTQPAMLLMSLAGTATALLVDAAEGRPRTADMIGFAAMGLAGAGAALLVCFPLIYGHGPLDYVAGIRAHASRMLSRGDGSGFLMTYVANRNVPLLVLGFYPAAMAGLAAWRRVSTAHDGRARRLWQAALAAALIACAVLIYRLGVRVPRTYYNFCGVLPALLLIAGAVCSRDTTPRARPGGWTARGYPIVLAMMALAAIGAQAFWWLQTLEEGPVSLANRTSLQRVFQQARRAGEPVCAEFPAIIGAPDVPAALAIRFTPITDGEQRMPSPTRCALFVVFQQLPGEPAPPVPGFTLVADRFTGGWRIPVRPLSDGYAVYRRLAPGA